MSDMANHHVLQTNRKDETMNYLKDDDYTLTDGAAWLDVKTLSVRIHSNEDGIIISVYRDKDYDTLVSQEYFDFED
jgi:hypothetical protein